MSINILLVDDHGVLRAGLRALLNAEPDMHVIGEADSVMAATSLLEKDLKPDVIIMDINMPGTDGLEGTRRIRANHPEMRVLLLTVHEDTSLLRGAIQAGASGYILKRAVESELINAIRAVYREEMYIHPAMTRAFLDEPTAHVQRQPKETTLTTREIDVLRRIAEGYTNRQIADLLCISVRTVESHRANLMSKLNLHSRVDLVRYAAEIGLLQPEDGEK